MSKSKSRRWYKEHSKDHYVKSAQAQGWRSRAAFKLLEIQEKYKIIQPGMRVIDVGAAPGGWSQVVSQFIGQSGEIIAVDLLEMSPLTDVIFIRGDITKSSTVAEVLSHTNERRVDLVISDMAPNLTGIRSIDQPAIIGLAEDCLEFVKDVLQPGGNFLVKLFQGEGFSQYLQQLRNEFTQVRTVKPKASQARSREIYQLATGLKVR